MLMHSEAVNCLISTKLLLKHFSMGKIIEIIIIRNYLLFSIDFENILPFQQHQKTVTVLNRCFFFKSNSFANYSK